MAWTAPKTNWTSNDYFNVADYNRIKNNIVHLSEMPETPIPMIAPMGNDRPVGALFYAAEINNFEANVSTLYDYIGEEYGEYPINYPNGPIIRWDELNRIESALLHVYIILLGTVPIYAIDANGVKAISDGNYAKARV